ncbi:MAG: hypothetical protein MUP30_02955 [Deltaproteobacteria bacterium]|nr:hypothetical protein [Deltaproteobacteria bacterium]
MLGGKVVVVLLGIIFFLIYGCGEQKGPASPPKSSSQPESSEQQESIQFPGLGVLEVKAQAIREQLPTVVIRNAAKKVLLQLEMGQTDTDSYTFHSWIEFQVRHITGLPDPLLMVVAAGSGGSAGRLEVALISVVSGELKLLWNQAAYGDRGGFFVGDLGKTRGIGIAQWYSSSSECHGCPSDKYFIEFHLWNKEKAQFDVGPTFTIEKEKFDTRDELGLNFPDQIEDFDQLDGR